MSEQALIDSLRTEADLCTNEHADDVAQLLNDAADALERTDRERARLDALLNTPEFHDFIKAVPLEAAHQVERWGTDHDAGKTCLDWFWLIGYLAQRVVEYDKAGNRDKALHHCVTTAAALLNWHSALEHQYNGKPYPMRPGHAPAVAQGEKVAA